MLINSQIPPEFRISPKLAEVTWISDARRQLREAPANVYLGKDGLMDWWINNDNTNTNPTVILLGLACRYDLLATSDTGLRVHPLKAMQDLPPSPEFTHLPNETITIRG